MDSDTNQEIVRKNKRFNVKVKHNDRPWDFLDQYRGKDFEGEWPGVVEMFRISCKRYPDNLFLHAFSPKEEKFTYREAEKKIEEVSYALLADGVKKGDKIAVSGKNSPEWAIAYLAVLFAGAIVVPLDYSLRDNEMEHLISFGGVSRLFIDKERIGNIDKDGNLGLKKYSLEPDSDYPFVLDMTGEKREGEKSSGNELAAILFTSGTTGTPKGVMLSHDNLVSDCYLAQGNMNIYSTDVFYAILPIHHAYTMLAVFFEARIVAFKRGKLLFCRRFEAEDAEDVLRPAAKAPFLPAAEEIGRKRSALAADERARPLCAADLMGAYGVKVNIGRETERELAERLHAVAQKETARVLLFDGFGKRNNVVDGARFVVDVDDRNERRLVVDKG